VDAKIATVKHATAKMANVIVLIVIVLVNVLNNQSRLKNIYKL